MYGIVCMHGWKDGFDIGAINLPYIYNTELLWYMKEHDLQSSPIEKTNQVQIIINTTCPFSCPDVLSFGYSICHNQQEHTFIQTELPIVI